MGRFRAYISLSGEVAGTEGTPRNGIFSYIFLGTHCSRDPCSSSLLILEKGHKLHESVPMLEIFRKGGEMASTDTRGYFTPALAGGLGLLLPRSAERFESGFLSLIVSRFLRNCAFFFAVLVIAPLNLAAQPMVDGFFDEWTPDTRVGTDAAGDASSVFDVTELFATSAGTQLYVSFDTSTVLNVSNGPDSEGTLRLEVGYQGAPALTIDFRNREAYTGGDPLSYVPWSALDFQVMPTYAADRFELRADLGAAGIRLGDTVTLDFSGSDTLDAPVSFTLEQPAEDILRRDPGPLECTTFRIASLNTLVGGLLDGGRGEPIGRLVQAVAADIYCFQEQGSENVAIADRLADLDPLNNGLSWNVHRVNDTVIATQHTMIPLNHGGDAAAVVDLGAEGAVLVFSIHPRCCGYIGHSRDSSRIAEMAGIVEAIRKLRAGEFGEQFDPYRDVPVIVIGDWNLVGSRTPLDMLEDPQGPDMAHWTLPHLIGDDVDTWRDLTESPGSFPPGLLDLLAFSDVQLVPHNGFVLDSSELNTSELQMLGLFSDDSEASDHLTLVGDFMFAGSECGCDDGNACTIDEVVSGSCTHTPVTCGDGDACTADSCDPATGCVNDPITPCCSNGVCESGESCNNCAADCISGTGIAACGNGICEAADGENCTNCPSDCNGKLTGKPGDRFCCGDGSCSGSCATGGFSCTVLPANDDNYCCGDSVCEAPENSLSCSIDCGVATCSWIFDKKSCDAEATCTWNNKDKVCVPN